MNEEENAKIERAGLNYKIAYMTHNVDKKRFPLTTSLPPELVVRLTDEIGDFNSKMHIQKILIMLERLLTILEIDSRKI